MNELCKLAISHNGRTATVSGPAEGGGEIHSLWQAGRRETNVVLGTPPARVGGVLFLVVALVSPGARLSYGFPLHSGLAESEREIVINRRKLKFFAEQLRVGDDEERLEAARQIWRIARADPETAAGAMPTLKRAVKDSRRDVRSLVIQTFGFLGNRAESIVPALLQTLEDGDKSIRYDAARSLALIGRVEDALPTLIGVLKNPSEDVDRAWDACQVLGSVGPPAKGAVTVLVENLSSESATICSASSDALRSILGPKSVRYFVGVLKNPDQVVRANAVEALGKVGGEAAVATDELSELLFKDDSEHVRAVVARTLGQIGLRSEKVIQALMRGCEDENRRVRVRAAGSLGVFEPYSPVVSATLGDSLGSRDREVRGEAVYELSRIVSPKGRALVPKLVLVLRDREAETDTLEIAVRALGRIGKPSVGPLTSLFAEEDWEVHFWAALALELIGSEANESVPSLLKVLEKREAYEKSASPTTEETNFRIVAVPGAAIKALSRVVGPRDDSAVPYLVTGLEWDNESLRCAAAEGLGRIGLRARSAVPTLKKSLKDPSPSVRKAAAAALEAIER